MYDKLTMGLESAVLHILKQAYNLCEQLSFVLIIIARNYAVPVKFIFLLQGFFEFHQPNI